MMDAETNPRAVIGSNQPPDEAVRVTNEMTRNYAELATTVAGLLDRARVLPAVVEDDETMGAYARLIKDLRDTAKRCEALHDAEKQPFLRAGQAVDGFFFSLWEKCTRRTKTAKPGAADVLQARLDAYNQRKLLAEQERRRREAAEQERIAREARDRAAREAQEAEDARLAAARARKPEIAEQKGALAAASAAAAAASAVEANVAAEQAIDARAATLARPADLVRTRVDEGPLVTMAQEAFAEVVDSAALDKEKLWPFIPEEAKAKALRAWARNTGHVVMMEGASIGKRSRSVVR